MKQKIPKNIEDFYQSKKSKNMAMLLIIIGLAILFFLITILRMNVVD